MKRFVTILIIVAILGAAGFFFYRWREQQSAAAFNNLQTLAASRGELVSTIGATGEVRSKQTTDLLWKTSGTVETVSASEGDQVQAGDRLAELKQTSLPQNVITAQAELVNNQKALEDLHTRANDAKIQALQNIATYAEAYKDAQYQLDNFTVPIDQADLDTMEALDVMEKRLQAARLAFEPYKYLASSNATREDLLDALNQAQSDYNTAVKRLEYEYSLEIAQANLEKARQDYAKWSNGPDPDEIAATQARIAASQATLSQAWIEAPFAGTITQAHPQPGDQVAPNTPAFRLDDLSTLLVDVLVSEVDINQVEGGQDATLTFDAILGKEYHGKVTDVARIGTAQQGVVEFVVTVELTDADEQVKPGMTAAVNIVVGELGNVLLVPNRAVRVQDGQRVVYILKDGVLTPVKITLGASSDVQSQVVEGELQPGDLIVLNPPTVFESNGPPPFVRNR
jgi:HlyD family secretion protein